MTPKHPVGLGSNLKMCAGRCLAFYWYDGMPSEKWSPIGRKRLSLSCAGLNAKRLKELEAENSWALFRGELKACLGNS